MTKEYEFSHSWLVCDAAAVGSTVIFYVINDTTLFTALGHCYCCVCYVHFDESLGVHELRFHV